MDQRKKCVKVQSIVSLVRDIDRDMRPMNANNTPEEGITNTLLTVAAKTVPDEDVLTEETVWANLAFADQMATQKILGVHPVMVMGAAALAYYALYPEKNPADLERAFRERNFDSGLIAVRWRDDEKLRPAVERGDVVVRPVLRGDRKADLQAAAPSEYYVLYSIRPREFAEKELGTHATSAEQNLARLEEAGDLGAKDTACVAEAGRGSDEIEETKVNEETGDTDTKSSEKFHTSRLLKPEERDFLDKVRKGRVRLCLHSVDMEAAWREAQETHPAAQEVMAMASGMGPIGLLAGEDGNLVCPYGRFQRISCDTGVQHQYVPLE